MQFKSDAQLLREYAEHGAESAFAEIVRRHTDLVYSAALRQMSSPDSARDVTQNVFTNLVRAAKSLVPKMAQGASLAGWLYRTTRNVSLNLRRDEFRRQTREREAMEQLHPTPETTPDWDRLRPLLDETMSELSDADHDALVLRFFENHDLRAVGQALGINDDTAQKRVARALERLRVLLSRRGILTTTETLSLMVGAYAVQSAPVGLATSLCAAASLTGTTLSSSPAVAFAQSLAMTTIQKTLLVATITLATGTTLYLTNQSSRLRQQVQAIGQQEAAVSAQLQQVQRERDDAQGQLATLQTENERLRKERAEVPRLRGEVSRLRGDVKELGKQTVAATPSNILLNSVFTNALSRGLSTARKFRTNDVLRQLARMKAKLNLSDEQEQLIRSLMFQRVELNSQLGLDLMLGKITAEQAEEKRRMLGKEDEEIKSYLNELQLAAYPEYQAEEMMTRASEATTSELSRMKTDLKLTQDQYDKIYPVWLALNQNQAQSENQAADQAGLGSLADRMVQTTDQQKQALEMKLQALAGILPSEQLETYRQQRLAEIGRMQEVMGMLMPGTNSGATR